MSMWSNGSRLSLITNNVGGSEKSRFDFDTFSLLGAGVLGDCLCALADRVLGKFAWKQQTDGRLYFATGDRRATIVVGQTGRLGSDALKDVIDETVHYRHGLAADSRVGVHLLEDLVDVDGVRLPSPPLSLLVPGSDGLGLAGRLLRAFARWFWWHRFSVSTTNDGRRTVQAH